jgi:hypothetical protein
LTQAADQLEGARLEDAHGAIATLRESSRRAAPETQAVLESLIGEIENAVPGWYLAEDVPPGASSILLRKIGNPAPGTIEEGFLIALVEDAREPLYRVTGVTTHATGAAVALSPPTRRAYSKPTGQPPIQRVIPIPERVSFFAGPSLTDAENRLVTSLGLGGGYGRTELTFGYANTDSGAGADLESWTGKAKILFRDRRQSNFNNQAALVMDVSEVRDIRQRRRAVLTGNLGVDGGLCRFRCRTNVFANAGWIEQELKVADETEDDDVDDFFGVIGFSHRFRPTIILASDYTLENDLDGQDGFTVTLTKLFADSRLTIGAAKHGTTFASYTATF